MPSVIVVHAAGDEALAQPWATSLAARVQGVTTRTHVNGTTAPLVVNQRDQVLVVFIVNPNNSGVAVWFDSAGLGAYEEAWRAAAGCSRLVVSAGPGTWQPLLGMKLEFLSEAAIPCREGSFWMVMRHDHQNPSARLSEVVRAILPVVPDADAPMVARTAPREAPAPSFDPKMIGFVVSMLLSLLLLFYVQWSLASVKSTADQSAIGQGLVNLKTGLETGLSQVKAYMDQQIQLADGRMLDTLEQTIDERMSRLEQHNANRVAEIQTKIDNATQHLLQAIAEARDAVLKILAEVTVPPVISCQPEVVIPPAQMVLLAGTIVETIIPALDSVGANYIKDLNRFNNTIFKYLASAGFQCSASPATENPAMPVMMPKVAVPQRDQQPQQLPAVMAEQVPPVELSAWDKFLNMMPWR